VDGLKCFFWGVAPEDRSDETPAWTRARAWFETAGLTEWIKTFTSRTKEVANAVDALLGDCGDPPRQPTGDDCMDLGVKEYVDDLRNWSRQLKQQFPPSKQAAPSRNKTGWNILSANLVVSEYLQQRMDQYYRLGQDRLNGGQRELQAFVAVFGASAISEHISRDGPKCSRQIVQNTPAYRQRILPLTKSPPTRPEGWNPPKPREHHDRIKQMLRRTRGEE
jgi:hypothetical protein